MIDLTAKLDKKPDKTAKLPVHNPTNEDFTVTYDLSGKGNPEPLTVPANEIAYFEPFLAEHLRKHLARHLMNVYGTKPNPEIAYKTYYDEVSLAGVSKLWD